MKRALLHSVEPGRICDVVDPGAEFEVHENFSWVDVPNDTTTSDRYNDDGTITKFDVLSIPGFAENAYKVARAIAYGDIGNQLDMLYHELNTTGTISNTGPWVSHIRSMKANIPKDDPQAVHEWNQAQWAANQANTAPI